MSTISMRRWGWRLAAASAVMVLGGLGASAQPSAPAAPAPPTAPAPSKPAAAPAVSDATRALAAWSERVWQSARDQKSDAALDLLKAPPASSVAQPLADSSARFQKNLQTWEGKRNDKIAELRKKFDEDAGKGELRKALRHLIELHELVADKDGLLAEPAVAKIIETAHKEAHRLEGQGRWLSSHGLFNRLNMLFEKDQRHKEDLKRLTQRLMMLRLYTPELLHAMNSEERVAEGEKPLPPYNPVGDDWRDKLRGVDRSMVSTAVAWAARNHVDKVPMSRMLTEAYRAVRTMATTHDLDKAFAGLGDEKKVAALVAYLDEQIAAIEKREGELHPSAALQGLSRLMGVNRDTVDVPSEVLLHEFGNGAMSALDEYTAIIWPDELERFRRTTEGKFFGVGIQISLNDAMELRVVTPLQGTPAAAAGIRAGDLIRKVNDDQTLGMGLSQAVERITGPKGSKVRLSIERAGEEGLREYELTRAEIPVYSVKGWERTGSGEMDWNYFIDPDYRIGYIRLTQFTRDTTADVRKAVEAMRKTGLNGLIVDLRYNPGGLLDEAVSISSLFVDDGVIVSQQDGDGRTREMQRARPGGSILKDTPTVVLINEGSASASEIVAGCLQDHRKAVLVGGRSFGKGSVQNVFPLSEFAQFKLTVQYYKLPNGRLIHRRDGSTEWGVVPDVTVEMLPDQIGDSLKLRQDADVVQFGPDGKPVLKDENHPFPSRLLTEGIDPQLEAALLLVQSRVVTERVVKQAALNAPETARP
ncbi:MAG: PDZ domain-containing protein [Phycisphaerales bacterium]|nr:PDZ domain-containing protein [Phycisphaerales bacterium]